MQSEHYDRVKKFMELAKQDTPDGPVMPDAKTRHLRASLIFEECLETIKALGFDVCIQGLEPITINKVIFFEAHLPDLVEIADGVADISVVSTGTLVACGIKDKKLLEVVDQNNLDKFGPGHSFREDGKLIKPPNHTKPDIKGAIYE